MITANKVILEKRKVAGKRPFENFMKLLALSILTHRFLRSIFMKDCHWHFLYIHSLNLIVKYFDLINCHKYVSGRWLRY